MDKNSEIYKKLITLLKLFKNRPHHLAKYLIDNDALNSEFTNSLINSNKISKISKDKIDKYNNFSDISQMEDFYESLLNNIDDKSEKEIIIEINKKLDDLIKSENYEEATKVRDYMKRKGIKRIN